MHTITEDPALTQSQCGDALGWATKTHALLIMDNTLCEHLVHNILNTTLVDTCQLPFQVNTKAHLAKYIYGQVILITLMVLLKVK